MSKQEDSGPKVPGYIVTFSDMVTLLLTFFVMLLSLAVVQDDEMFHASRDAFVHSINTMGLGSLMGKNSSLQFSQNKIKYAIKSPSTPAPARTIDARKIKIQSMLKKLKNSATIRQSPITSTSTAFSITNIRFAKGKHNLSSEAESFLINFSKNIQNSAKPSGLYVLSICKDQPTESQNSILSAKRAGNIAQFLRESFPSGFRCPVYSLGAGSGGNWTSGDNPLSKGTQIFIGILN